ncbi:MAG TPA: hypothetical protein VN283_10590, partial [Thiobacillus sp.]|nr:hypothetical protein [Thiobacillus sp.]
MEAVLSPANMKRAWARVKSNRGAPGIDGMRIEDFPAYAREHWPAIRQAISDGRYQPHIVSPFAFQHGQEQYVLVREIGTKCH